MQDSAAHDAGQPAREWTSEPQTVTIPIVLPLNQHARVWMMLAGVLGIMLVASLVIVGYLWNINGKWQDQVESLTDTGYSLGDQVAQHETEIQQLESTNELLSGQLTAAKDTVLTLSDEKAQWNDETAFAQQQVDLLVDQVSTAQSVIAQLDRCIEGEQQLLAYMDAIEEYSPAQIEQYRNSVAGLCEAASVSVTEFQKSLTE